MGKQQQVKGTISFENAIKGIISKGDENSRILKVSLEINNLIDALVAEREMQKLTQRDMAKLLGLKQPAIPRFENLIVMPRLDTFFNYVEALGMKFMLYSTFTHQVEGNDTYKYPYDCANENMNNNSIYQAIGA